MLLKKQKTPYQHLKPYFEELSSAMDGIFNDDDIVRISKYLNNETLLFKKRMSERMHPNTNPPGTMISVGHPCCKEKRTHHAIR